MAAYIICSVLIHRSVPKFGQYTRDEPPSKTKYTDVRRFELAGRSNIGADRSFYWFSEWLVKERSALCCHWNWCRYILTLDLTTLCCLNFHICMPFMVNVFACSNTDWCMKLHDCKWCCYEYYEYFVFRCISNSDLTGCTALPSMLWRCWLGSRKGIRPVKNWVMGCWRGCLG